jgi:hypothetical protein
MRTDLMLLTALALATGACGTEGGTGPTEPTAAFAKHHTAHTRTVVTLTCPTNTTGNASGSLTVSTLDPTALGSFGLDCGTKTVALTGSTPGAATVRVDITDRSGTTECVANLAIPATYLCRTLDGTGTASLVFK